MTIRHLYPAVEPSLNLDFANSKRLDPRITFTRASTGTYTDESGIIRTAAQDEARFDHDGDGNSLGLLIEESRTNLTTNSGDFSGWQTFNTTTLTDQVSAPDGTTTADLIYPSSTGTYRAVRKYHALSAGSYVTSIFAKSNGINFLTIGDLGSSQYRAWFDLQNGSVGDVASGYSATIQRFPNGWCRCSLFHSAELTGWFYVGLADSNGSTTATASGTNGIYIWGAQLEAGSFPTSYIPTSGSTVTRSADVASMTGTNFSSWYNQDQGTFTLKTSALKSGAGGSLLLGGISGAGYGEIEIFNNITEVWFIDYLNSPFRKISHDVSVGENIISASYDNQTAQAIAVNGTVSTTSQAFTANTNIITGITLMYRNPAGLQTTGHISRLTYYPVRLPDATLQALTL